METISAYLMGRIQMGAALATEDIEAKTKRLLETFAEIEEIDIITGEWDILIRLQVASMEQYYHVAWGIAKHLERGWGTVVVKKIQRPIPPAC